MTARARIGARKGAFTLLEVMVAVGILGLALTAIFSSEVGSIHVGARARKLGMATLLARCKMGEIEEQVANEGLPAIDDSGTDECCEDGEIKGFSCAWKIDRVVLPDVSPDESTNAPDTEAEAEAEASQTLGGTSVDELSPQGVLTGSSPNDLVSELALNFAFPAIKPAIEEQVRRATVTVRWNEGKRERSFDVVQYLVGPPGAPESP